MLAGQRDITNTVKSERNVSEKKDERRALKGSRNLWLNENITAP
jgi:hypothetical protein